MSSIEYEVRKAEQRGYQRGFKAAAEGRWPYYKPIEPPHEITAAFMLAAQHLRDEADAYCATLEPDDDLVSNHLGPAIEALDKTVGALVKWLAKTDEAKA